MREVFEADVHIDVGGGGAFFADEVVGFLEAAFLEPAAGGDLEDLLEVAFEGGEASAGEVGEAFQLYVEVEVLVHESFEVYFTGLAEIEEDVFQSGIGLQQDEDGLFQLEGKERFIIGLGKAVVRHQRLHKAFIERAGFQLQHGIVVVELLHGSIAVFQAEIAKGFLVEENGYGGTFSARGRLLHELYQVVPPAEPEIAFIAGVYLVAIVDGECSAYLVSENVFRYKLLPFPAPGVVAGIHYLWFLLFRYGHIDPVLSRYKSPEYFPVVLCPEAQIYFVKKLNLSRIK